MTPSSSSRASRSATAGEESPTRRPSSASDSRASSCSSASRRRLVKSRFDRRFVAIHGSLPANGHGRARCRAASCGGMRRRPPPHLYFVVSAIFHYLGPAFAVLLFARVGVLGVAWLRIVSAAVVFAAWRRPWRAFATLDRGGRRLVVAWGVVLAAMNACFYT